MGVVYYANYLVWFEVGRNAFFRARGDSYRRWEEEGLLLPVVEAACSYHHPARYDDEVTVTTTLDSVTAARLTFRYRIERDGVLLAEGHTVHAFVNKEGRPLNLKKAFPTLWDILRRCVTPPSGSEPDAPAAGNE
ncbi:MAG TPA: acyl-CoA thioesterase [Firmicutes bacterium]|nr:acyl-CoA thioesterase [Bacillota bacterium]